MEFHDHPYVRPALLACCLALAFPLANAAETGTTTTTATTTTAVGTSENTEAKLTAEFAEFLGGEEQAQTVVSGLRQGTAFDLETQTTTTNPTTGATTTTTTTTTIDPPTGTMGYGNVRITLRLAEAQLNQLGITDPTPEQLSAVLLGGTINNTQVNGILAMRADGMGWGQIAQQYGMTVGQLMGNGAGLTKQPIVSAQPKTVSKTTSASSSTNKSSSASSAHSNGYIPSGKSAGAGIVTGTGSSVSGSGNGNSKGQTNKTSAQGGGVLSAGGQHAAATGASNAAGGASTAPGQIKKN